MFYNMEIYAFVVVAVLARASAAPTDSVSSNPVFELPCVKGCAIGYDYSPFCGTDAQDYPSKTFLNCFQTCRLSITKAYDGKCRSESKPVDDCMRNCPVTADYRPFCASDGNTYPTKSMLRCFTQCNKNITMVYEGICKPPSALTHPCVHNCETTHDSTPFCGTDNNEYSTEDYLHCFKKCGLNINKAHSGPCPKEQFVQIPIA